MNYELAKQLKDAGFSQDKKSVGYGICPHNHENYLTCPKDCEQEDTAYLPDLSELIDACGERFGELERDDEGIENGGVRWISHEEGTRDKGLWGTGKTPEEAVAKLWLKLNEKENITIHKEA